VYAQVNRDKKRTSRGPGDQENSDYSDRHWGTQETARQVQHNNGAAQPPAGDSWV